MLNENRLTELESIISTASVIHFDLDHTLVSSGVPQEDGIFREEKLLPHELENIHLLIDIAISGLPVSIITARENSVFPLISYIETMIMVRLNQLGVPIESWTYSDGRLKTIDGQKPIIFTISNANGALSADLMSNEYIYLQQLPDTFWVGITEPEIRQLLRESTDNDRFDLTKAATPQYWATPENYEEQPASVEHAQALIGDFALVSPIGTRVNFKLSEEKILTNPKLRDQWQYLTGVHIHNLQDLKRAFIILSQDWGVYITGSNSVPTFDVMHENVNKGACTEIIRQYIDYLYQKYELETPPDVSVAVGDSPGGNDGPMLNRTGGISVTAPPKTYNGWPIYFKNGEMQTQRTNNLLKLLLKIRNE